MKLKLGFWYKRLWISQSLYAAISSALSHFVEEMRRRKEICSRRRESAFGLSLRFVFAARVSMDFPISSSLVLTSEKANGTFVQSWFLRTESGCAIRYETECSSVARCRTTFICVTRYGAAFGCVTGYITQGIEPHLRVWQFTDQSCVAWQYI